MATNENRQRSSVLQHFWNGIKTVGGFWPWCMIAGIIGLIFGAVATAIAAVFKHDLTSSGAWTIWKWSFWTTIVLCAVVTTYLEWNSSSEE